MDEMVGKAHAEVVIGRLRSRPVRITRTGNYLGRPVPPDREAELSNYETRLAAFLAVTRIIQLGFVSASIFVRQVPKLLATLDRKRANLMPAWMTCNTNL